MKNYKNLLIKNEDFIIQKSDNQRFPKNEEQKTGGDFKRVDYMLSVSCMEFFVSAQTITKVIRKENDYLNELIETKKIKNQMKLF